MRKRVFKNSCIILCLILIISSFMPAAFAGAENSVYSESSAAVNQMCGTIGNAAYYDSENGAVGIARESSCEVSGQAADCTIRIPGTIDYTASFEGLKQLNAIRSEKGLPALKMSADLLDVANLRAAECAVYYSHTRPDGRECFTAFPAGNYWKGENIAIGYDDITSVTNAWKASRDHYTNMVHESFTEVGIGCFVTLDGTETWVQVFGGGRSFTEASNKSGKTSTTYSVGTSASNITMNCPTGDINLKKGEYISFSLYIKNKGANGNRYVQIIPGYTNSSNTGVATYENHRLYGKGPGTCTVKIGLDSVNCFTRTVTVTDPVSVTGISLSVPSLSLKEGESQTITATVSPSNATDQTVTWQSSNPSVASVVSSGKQVSVTAKAAGTAVITAKCGGKTATCQVTVAKNVADVPVTGVTLNKFSLSMKVGEVMQVAGSTVPTDATSKEIQWSISNTSVAGLSLTQSGSSWTGGPLVTNKSTGSVYIKALAPGTAVLTASSGGKSKTVNVTVSGENGNGSDTGNDNGGNSGNTGGENAPTSVSLNKYNVVLTEGDTTSLNAGITPSDLTGYRVAWNIGNSSVVRISSQGTNTVSFKALKEGTTSITASVGNYSATCSITVKKKEVGPEDNPSLMTFYDVGKSDWFYDYVKYVYQKKIMNGVGNNCFAPNTSISRAMIVQILYNMQNGKAVYGSKSSSYADVKTNEWYSTAVKWAASNGIVSGYENGTFRPNNPITREQLVTILFRYGQYKKYNLSARESLRGFNDYNRISSYAVSAFEWAYAAGIVSGKTAYTLDPQGKATRAETAAIMMRFCKYYNI